MARWKQTLSTPSASGCERLRWSPDENAPVLSRVRVDRPRHSKTNHRSRHAGRGTLKWLSVFGLCTRREPFAFATSPAAQPAAEEVDGRRWWCVVCICARGRRVLSFPSSLCLSRSLSHRPSHPSRLRGPRATLRAPRSTYNSTLPADS